jgi:CPA1 family monovalent cation:H+ antiporter
VVHSVELVLGLMVLAVVLGVLARWLKIPYPILLVIGGVLLGLQPDLPSIPLDPNLVFFLFLPPLLYAGAFRTPWIEFRRQIRAITMLAVGLVFFSTAVVAVFAHYVIGLPWASGFVLGAIVSPPDAVAAMAVTQRLRVPRIIVTILDGESLVNDGSALVIMRLAIAAFAASTFSVWDAGLQFVGVSLGGIVIGLSGAIAVIRLHGWLERTRLADEKIQITITLLTPYAVYLAAESLEVSGVLAAVAAGLWVGNRSGQVFSKPFYQEATAVWEWVEFLINSFVFILLGFALRNIIDTLDDGHSFEEVVTFCVLLVLVVIVARIIWMFPGAYVPRWLDRQLLGKRTPYPPWQYVLVTGWSGMRGVVSLAAALALPQTLPDGQPFPGRSLIQLLTFAVIFSTLVGQGLTLPLVMRVLGVGTPAVNTSEVSDEEKSDAPLEEGETGEEAATESVP